MLVGTASAPPNLQRTVGNRSYAELVRSARDPVQAPLAFEVEASNSAAELEARQVATRVATSVAPPAAPPPAPLAGGAGSGISGTGSTGGGGYRVLAGPDAARVERALQGGSSLPDGLRTRLEGHLARSLGNVRVHRGPAADAAAHALGAIAFTVGRDIVLGTWAPELGSPGGLRLIAHEVTHIVQGPGLSGVPRIRMETGDDGVSGGAQVAPAVDEEPGRGLDVRRARRLNPAWWRILELEEVHPLGAITPEATPNTYANRVAAIQRAAAAPHLRAYLVDGPLSIDGIMGPRTLLFLSRLSVSEVPAGDLEPFTGLGVDLAALASAIVAVSDAEAILHRPLIAARWTSAVSADRVLRYYRQRYQINRDDADLLDRVIFGGPAPADVTRDDRHELLSLVYGSRKLPAVGALVTINRRYVHRYDAAYVVTDGSSAGGLWSTYFSFRLTTGGAVDQAVEELGVTLPSTVRARRVLDGLRAGDPAPPLHGLLLAYDLPPVDEDTRMTTVEPYLARQRIAREQRRQEAEEHNRLAAHERADRFIDLADDQRDLEFILKLKELVQGFGGRAEFFQYFLDDLRGRDGDWFGAFFDAVESTRTFVVHAPVIRLVLGTTYATDKRVSRSITILNSRRRGAMRSQFEADGVAARGLGRPAPERR